MITFADPASPNASFISRAVTELGASAASATQIDMTIHGHLTTNLPSRVKMPARPRAGCPL